MPGGTSFGDEEVVPEGVIGADEREPGLANERRSHKIVGGKQGEDGEEEVRREALEGTLLRCSFP